MDPMLAVMLTILVLIGSVAAWTALTWLIGMLSGWSRLAQSFQCYHQPESEIYRMRSISIGMMGGYNNCVTVGLSAEGIYLKPMSIFAFSHSPLLIPWSYVVGIKENSWFKGGRGMELRLNADGKKVSVFVPPTALPTIERLAPRSVLAALAEKPPVHEEQEEEKEETLTRFIQF